MASLPNQITQWLTFEFIGGKNQMKAKLHPECAVMPFAL
ncbi:hypothetical protein B739_1470 [Riemerella anatipestifer RA-CH-1]|uniref:Uncharacterized protein n=1 Tax=Riemerella anatipestifer RA-CH-1 TaxID=1228997 RepID=J9R2J9_RIEAN|nr:hypothetical protein B739_1470 [Riemerella anatipestifer RA-CH-1]